MDSADFDALEEQARARLSPGAYAFAAAGADDEITVADERRCVAAAAPAPAHAQRHHQDRHRREHVGHRARHADHGGAVRAPQAVSSRGRARDRARRRPRPARSSSCRPRPRSASRTWRPSPAPRRAGSSSTCRPTAQLAENLVDRAAAAGFSAIVLTVDQPVYGASPRAARAPLAPSPDIRNANLPGQPIAQNAYKAGYTGTVTCPATWRDLEWLVRRSPVDVLVKGVLRGDDAVRCVDAGAKAIIVSNHGGRHLDGTIATADALAEIAAHGRRQRGNLCRRRHPPRHRYRQGARARRPRRAGRAPRHLGTRARRGGRRAHGAGSSACRARPRHGAVRHRAAGRDRRPISWPERRADNDVVLVLRSR